MEAAGVADEFSDRVRRLTTSLSPAAARVASYLDQNRAQALAISAAQVGAHVGISDATVVRAVQALGFDGLPDLKQGPAADLGDRMSPATNMRRTLLEVGENASQAVAAVLDAHAEGIRRL